MKNKEFKFRHRKKQGKHICMVCGLCVASCLNQALSLAKSKPNLTWDDMIVHNLSKCSGCGMCAKVCPEGMIIIKTNVRRLKNNGKNNS